MDSITGMFIGMSFGAGMVALAIVLVLVYFVPSIVAHYRKHRNFWPLFILNIIFGSTGIGWIVLLIWALLDQERGDRNG